MVWVLQCGGGGGNLMRPPYSNWHRFLSLQLRIMQLISHEMRKLGDLWPLIICSCGWNIVHCNTDSARSAAGFSESCLLSLTKILVVRIWWNNKTKQWTEWTLLANTQSSQCVGCHKRFHLTLCWSWEPDPLHLCSGTLNRACAGVVDIQYASVHTAAGYCSEACSTAALQQS